VPGKTRAERKLDKALGRKRGRIAPAAKPETVVKEFDGMAISLPRLKFLDGYYDADPRDQALTAE
jgi:hypothetical protein